MVKTFLDMGANPYQLVRVYFTAEDSVGFFDTDFPAAVQQFTDAQDANRESFRDLSISPLPEGQKRDYLDCSPTNAVRQSRWPRECIALTERALWGEIKLL